MRWLTVFGGVALMVALSVAVLLSAPSGLSVRYGPDGNPVTSPAPSRGEDPLPSSPPCPRPAPTTPAPATISCGPAAGPGNGAGPGGVCTGTETAPPCGPGAMPGTYYPYSLAERCDGLAVFDGKVWRSELPPPVAGPTQHVWMALAPGGGAGFISPQGVVGFTRESSIGDAGTPLLPVASPCPAGNG